jgi:hypothetical protein
MFVIQVPGDVCDDKTALGPELARVSWLVLVDASFDLVVGTNAWCCAYYLTQRFGA